MSKVLKRFLAFAMVFAILTGFTATIFAGRSSQVTITVLPWGQWSLFSSQTAFRTTGQGGCQLTNSGFAFPLTCQLYKTSAVSQQNEKALQYDVTLVLNSWTFSPFWPSQDAQTYYKSAVRSSNYEPSTANIQYYFWP